MGKSIDLTKPLSREDREWLEQQGKIGDLRVNAELVALQDVSPVVASEAADEAEAVEYGAWTNAQLRYELEQRGLPQGGAKQDLVDRLIEADDQQ